MMRWKGCLLWCLGLGLLSGFLIWWFFPQRMVVPPVLRDSFQQKLQDRYGIQLTSDDLVLDPGQGKASLASFGIAIPGQAPFFGAERAAVGFASGTRWTDLLAGEVALDDLVISKGRLDLRAPLPELGNLSGPSTPPGLAALPLKRFSSNDLEVKTWFGDFRFPTVEGNVRRLAGVADLFLHLAQNPLGGEVLATGAFALGQGTSEASVSVRDLKAAAIPGLLWLDFVYGVHIGSGTIDADLSWKGNLPAYLASGPIDWISLVRHDLAGRITVKGAEIGFRGAQWSADLDLDKAGAETASWTLTLRQATGTIRLEGAWDGSKGLPGRIGFHLKVDRVEPQLEWFPKVLETRETDVLPGEVSLECRGRFDGTNLETEGEANLRSWMIEDKPLEKAELTWSQRGSSLQGSFTAVLSGATIAGSGSLARDPRWEVAGQVDGTVSDLDLETLSQYHSGILSGICRGPFHLHFPTDDGKVGYEASLQVTKPRVLHIESGFFEGRVRGEGAKWELLDPSTIFTNGGMLDLQGMISPAGLDADATCERLDLAQLGLPSSIASGCISFKGKLRGTLEHPVIRGNAWAEKFTLFSQLFDTFKAGLEIENGLLTIDPIAARAPDNGLLDGFLAVDLAKGRLFSTRLGLTEVPLARVKEFLPESWQKTDLRGRVSGTVRCGPASVTPGWDFTLSARNLVVGSETIDFAAVEGSLLEGQGELRRLLIEGFGGSFESQGRFLAGGAAGDARGGDVAPPGRKSASANPVRGDGTFFVGSVRATNLSLEKVASLRPWLPQARGQISLEGNLNWSPTEKLGHLSLFGKDIWVRDRELGNLGADVSIDPERMHITQATFDKMGVSLSGDVQFDRRLTYRGQLALEKTDLSFIPVAHGFTAFNAGDLLVSGACTVAGDVASGTPDVLDARFDRVEIRRGNDLIQANRPMEILFQNGIFEVRAFELRFREGVIGVEGTWDPGHRMALTVSGEEFSLQALGNLLEIPGWKADGQLSLQGGVVGSLEDPRISGTVTVKNLAAAGRQIPEVQAKCALSTDSLKIDQFLIRLPNNLVEMAGTLPLPLASEGRSMDLRVRIASGPIHDLPMLLPEIFNQASGSLRTEFRLTGNPLHPAVSGDLLLVARTLGFRGMQTPLASVTVKVQTHDGMVEIGPVEARLGRGLLIGGGKIDFRDGPGSMTAYLRGEKLDFSWGGLEAHGVSVQGDASGNLYNPVVRCRIKIPRGKARATGGLLAMTPGKIRLPFQSLDYRVDVDVPRNFWVRNSFLNAELRGKFGMSGTLTETHFNGSVKCVQGWLFFQRRKFQLDSGELKFGEREGVLDPHMYLKSVTNIQNIQVFLVLEGQMSSFTPRIYSSPPMSEGDLFALLTLGRSMDEAKQSDPRQLFEKEILEGLKNTYLSGLLGSTLSTALNLDELYLGSLFDRTTGITRSFLRIGKYIGRNFFFAFEGTLSSEGQKTYIIEYRLPRGFLINLEVEKPINRTRIGVKYDWKF